MCWMIGSQPLAPREPHVVAEQGGLCTFVVSPKEGTTVWWSIADGGFMGELGHKLGPKTGWGLGSYRKREETDWKERAGDRVTRDWCSGLERR